MSAFIGAIIKKKLFNAIIIIVLSGFAPIFPGCPESYQWPDSLDSARDAVHLTDNEKAVIREMNMVRTNPKLYAVFLEEEVKLYEGNIRIRGEERIVTKEGISAIKECIEYLYQVQPAGILKFDENLYKAANDHCSDQSKSGCVGHVGSDQSTPFIRMTQYHEGLYLGLAENIAYGQFNARDIVIQLLVDDDVPDRGHRYAIMNPRFDACGVSVDTHPRFRYMCVINYITYYTVKKKRKKTTTRTALHVVQPQ